MRKISQIFAIALLALGLMGASTSDNKYTIKGQDASQDINVIFGTGVNLIGIPSGGGNLRFSDNSGAGFTQFSDIGANSSGLIENVTVDTSVGAGAMTVSMKIADGTTDASAGNPVKIAYRDAVAADGAYNLVLTTGALSIIIPSGATLGHVNGSDGFIYIYALENIGSTELSISSALKDESILQTSQTINAGSDDDDLYSTTGRSGVPIRLIARLTSNQVTAGSYLLDVIENTPGVHTFTELVKKVESHVNNDIVCRFRVNNSGGTPSIFDDGNCLDSVDDDATGAWGMNFVAGTFSGVPICQCTMTNGSFDRATHCGVTTQTGVDSISITASTGAGFDADHQVFCIGPK